MNEETVTIHIEDIRQKIQQVAKNTYNVFTRVPQQFRDPEMMRNLQMMRMLMTVTRFKTDFYNIPDIQVEEVLRGLLKAEADESYQGILEDWLEDHEVVRVDFPDIEGKMLVIDRTMPEDEAALKKLAELADSMEDLPLEDFNEYMRKHLG